MSADMSWVATHFAVLQLYSRNVSSSPAVMIWPPLSSNDMPVMCRGPVFSLGRLPAAGSGPGSTAVLNILAGFSFPCDICQKVSGKARLRITMREGVRVKEWVGPVSVGAIVVQRLGESWDPAETRQGTQAEFEILSSLLIMSSSDDSEAVTLWKVNRTIHELVKDRVSSSIS